MFEWSELMTTGFSGLDDQHRGLINKFNELVEAETAGADHKTIGEILDFLQDYAERHFSTEEEIMEKYECHMLEDNKRAHNEFRDKFGNIYKQWEGRENSDAKVLHQTIVELARWIVNHILTIDNQLYMFVKK